jgi:hypothetical protein
VGKTAESFTVLGAVVSYRGSNSAEIPCNLNIGFLLTLCMRYGRAEVGKPTESFTVLGAVVSNSDHTLQYTQIFIAFWSPSALRYGRTEVGKTTECSAALGAVVSYRNHI